LALTGNRANRRQPLLYIMTNFRHQLARTETFRHVVITASRSRLLFLAAERTGGERDDTLKTQELLTVRLDVIGGRGALVPT
jgi:hypothetical protein